MVEYPKPGTYAQEIPSASSNAIVPAATGVAVFFGPTRRGPTSDRRMRLPIGSVSEFIRIHGDVGDLVFPDNLRQTNFVAHSVRAFFDNGGVKLYVARVFEPAMGVAVEDHTASVSLSGDAPNTIVVSATSPGSGGNGRLELQQVAVRATWRTLDSATKGSIARVFLPAVDPMSPPGFALYIKVGDAWQDAAGAMLSRGVDADPNGSPGDEAYLLLLSLTFDDGNGLAESYEGLSPSTQAPRWIGSVLAPSNDHDAWSASISIRFDGSAAIDLAFMAATFMQPRPTPERLYQEPLAIFALAGGSDGMLPDAGSYQYPLTGVDHVYGGEVSMVAAPGYSALPDRLAIENALIAYVEMPFAWRMAILDSPPQASIAGITAIRAQIDCPNAALYYPWIMVPNPASIDDVNAPKEIALPPSAFVCGLCVKADIEHGIMKSPGLGALTGTAGVETELDLATLDLLDSLGINTIRRLPGTGVTLWGARTISSDPQWRYLAVRRYFNYLEASIEGGTSWAVFEKNDQLLWAKINNFVEAFLTAEWKRGALQGATASQAFFVRCDQSTLTQFDIDSGCVRILVGVATIRPSEFTVFVVTHLTGEP